MRRLTALTMIFAATASSAQVPTVFPPFDPARDYITSGQDERGYQAWVKADPARPPAIAAYYAYLVQQQVAGIVPTWQLLRTASSWQRCAAQPFEVPPAEQWANIVETLRYINAHIVPVIGPVEPVSVYRNPLLNYCAGGAPGSAHQDLRAIDLVPLRPIEREGLIRSVCRIHVWRGASYDVGLGFYVGLRFHVDSKKFRRWGGGGESSACAAVAPELKPPQANAPAPGLAPPIAATTPPPPTQEPAVPPLIAKPVMAAPNPEPLAPLPDPVPAPTPVPAPQP